VESPSKAHFTPFLFRVSLLEDIAFDLFFKGEKEESEAALSLLPSQQRGVIMRTTVTGALFIVVLASALYWVALFTGLPLLDLELSAVIADTDEASVARFEPSSAAIVEEMLRIAGVTRGDIVYDLGSGDGRIVIAAARTGARAVGVDLDADLISESRRNAERENVEGLAQFVHDDLFRTDISKATVVMLYLSPSGNSRLRPRLLAELQPGARVVSHSHDMEDWKPDGESTVQGHTLYLWIVPADVSGAWKLEVTDKYAGSDSRLEFGQQFQVIQAELKTGPKTIPLAGATLRGKAVRFTLQEESGSLSAPAEFSGTVEGEVMKGTFRSKTLSGRWTARRIVSTRVLSK
jgi:hypothetical protein